MNNMDKSRQIPAWVVILCLLTLVFGIGNHDLWTPDEPREAGIAKAMAEGGSWLIPELGGSPFVEKPPLYYWVSALMMKTIGRLVGPTTATRAVSALAAALTLLVTWLTVRSTWGAYRGAAVVLILSTTYGFIRGGHWIQIDPLLMFLITASVLLLYRGLAGDCSSLILSGYFLGGLAFLTKGFVAWALLAPPWGTLFILFRHSMRRRVFLHLAGFCLLLIPPAAWMWLFRAEGGPELWREWFIDNQIGRFSGSSRHLGHLKGPSYYFWVLPALLMPWTIILIGEAVGSIRLLFAGRVEERKLLLLALVWGLGGFALLSLASTKREVYIYPLLPAFAIIIAFGIAHIPRWCRASIGIFSALVLQILVVFSFLVLSWSGNGVIAETKINLPIFICAAGAIYSIVRFRGQPFLRLAAIAAIFYIAFVLAGFPVLDNVWSYRGMTEKIARSIPAASRNRVCVYGRDETTQAVFRYYADLTLPTVKDLFRVNSILGGSDPEFDLIVIPRMHEFYRGAAARPPFRILTQAEKGPRRIFYLIGRDSLPKD